MKSTIHCQHCPATFEADPEDQDAAIDVALNHVEVKHADVANWWEALKVVEEK